LVLPASVGLPHCGQKRLRFASFEPQFAHLATRADPRPLRRPGAQLERPEGLGGATPERLHETAVILVRDLAGAVIELELLECGKRTVTLLGELQPPPLELVRPVEPVVPCLRLAQERPGDEQGTGDRERRADDQSDSQTRTAASA
jgi:hypothetical protein